MSVDVIRSGATVVSGGLVQESPETQALRERAIQDWSNESEFASPWSPERVPKDGTSIILNILDLICTILQDQPSNVIDVGAATNA